MVSKVHHPDPQKAPARRHLKIMAALVLSAVAVVVCVNALTFWIVSKPENARVAQLVSGWDRTYKPILYDRAKPQVLALGASWVRDAFDPVTIQNETGLSIFNMGVSGGTSYEAERFLQSALAAHAPQRVILNLNSLGDVAEARRTQFGFNENLLNVDENGQPNTFVEPQRAYAIYFSGAALGYGYKVAKAWWAIRSGAPLDEALDSYDRMNFTEWRQTLDAIAKSAETGAPLEDVSWPRKRGGFSSRLSRLDGIIDTLCARGIALHVYATGHHALQSQCNGEIENEMAAYDLLSQKAAQCAASITYHVFEYPNALTLEGVWRANTQSQYYRSDGHPRPTLGSLMFNKMLAIPVSAGRAAVTQDFGADLLTMNRSQAEAWLGERKARCEGEWTPQALSATRAASAAIVPD